MPPARFAALIRRSAHRCGSGSVSRIAAICILGHHVGESVAAQQDPVAIEQRNQVFVDRDVLSRAHGMGDDVALGMHLGLCLGDLAGFHHAGDQRVVVGELAERARTHQVGAAVPDVGQAELAALVDRGRQGGTHAGDGRVFLRTLEHGAVGLLDLLGERALVAVEELFDRVQGQVGGDLAALVPAHAVGDRVERGLHQVGILVALPNPADVGGDPDVDPHRRSSTTVVPSEMRSPGWTRAGAASRWSFTEVPFVEPRSSTYQWSSFAKIRACCCET